MITAAGILRQPIVGLGDSKKLTSKQRETFTLQIKQEALYHAYGRVEVEKIDVLNIHHATLLAIKSTQLRHIKMLYIDLVLVQSIENHSPHMASICSHHPTKAFVNRGCLSL